MQTSMQFKSFVWPHNPTTFESRMNRQVAVLKYPRGGYALQDLGESGRIFEGRGEFYGANAYGNFRLLAQVFCQDGAGTLYHPAWGSYTAYFTALQLLQEPVENYVSYAFTFRVMQPVSTKAASQKTSAVVTLQPGQTLQSICSSYAISMEELLEKNPEIANPAFLQDGTKVVLECSAK